MTSSNNSLRNHTAIITAAGVIYYFLFTRLVGIGAAIAAPSWFVPFMRDHQSLGLALMSLVTHIPAIAISAAIVGYAIGRLLPGKHFCFGILAVCVTVLFSALLAIDGIGFWATLRNSVIPRYLFTVPTVVALWLFLPLAAYLFGRKRSSGRFRGSAEPV